MPKCDFCDKDAVATISYKDITGIFVRDVCADCLQKRDYDSKIINCSYFDKSAQAENTSSKSTAPNLTVPTEGAFGLDNLFSNPGNKIKTLAKVVFIIGLIIAVIGAIVCWAIGGNMRYGGEALIGTGFGVLILLPLGTFISSLFLYGFGQLIENTEEIKNNTKK